MWCYTRSVVRWLPPLVMLLAAAPVLAERPLAEQAREVLNERCGECHDGKRDTAKPKALVVFDVSRERWFETIHDEQLDKLGKRLTGMGAPAEIIARIQAFVIFERGRRAAR